MKSAQTMPNLLLPNCHTHSTSPSTSSAKKLKSQKFFDTLSKAGIEMSTINLAWEKAVMMNMGMDDGKDETFEFYYSVIEKRSKKIAMDRVYDELTMEKERRKKVSSS
jgi:hypothetical protein